MKRSVLLAIACITAWWIGLSAPSMSKGTIFEWATTYRTTPVPVIQASPEVNLADSLYPLARSITVKVMAGANQGSGILLRRQGWQYTLLTNRHVVTPGPPYVIQTPDGRKYPGSLIHTIDFQVNDLMLMQFRSRATYETARLGSSFDLIEGADLLSAGYPIEADPAVDGGFLLTTGQVSLLPEQAFVGGYQIGYTNLIYQGMSGGPVLNREGQVVGINSLHAYPLWGDPYVFEDGSHPPEDLREVITRSSWAIPIETFLCLVQPASRYFAWGNRSEPITCPVSRLNDEHF